MAFIAPTQRIVTQVVPTTMPALGDLTTALSSIGAGILNYYNTTKTGASTTMTADMQAALLAQQQQDSDNTTLMVGAAAVGAIALIWYKMRKPKGGK